MQKTSLTALVRQQLKIATAASSGRSAPTVFGGHEHVLRQTVIALAAGHRLDEHDNPGEATVHVLHGRVHLTAGDGVRPRADAGPMPAPPLTEEELSRAVRSSTRAGG